MKSLKEYIVEAEQWMEEPATGDDFAIELEDGTLIETYIMATEDNAILLDSTEDIYSILGEWAQLCEDIDDDVEEDQSGMIQLDKAIGDAPVKPVASVEEDEMSEAEYQGRKVPLGKPMRGDVKKFKVYVRDPKTGNVKKVNFGHGGTSAKRAGQKTMKIKKSNPARRKSFRARHNCANPGPRTKARYWSCRAW